MTPSSASTAQAGPFTLDGTAASCAGSCAIPAGQTVSFAGGRFTVTNLGSVSAPAGAPPTTTGAGPSIMATYDGGALILSNVDAQNDRIPGCVTVNGIPTEMQCSNPQGELAFTVALPSPAGSQCLGTPVPAGWNLLSGVAAARVNLNVGPLYNLPFGASTYQMATPGADLPASDGYWVFFASPTRVFATCGPPQFVVPLGVLRPNAVTADAGWGMIGNPFGNGHVTVSGADGVYIYDAATGYQQTATLESGQGAFAHSANGGTITISPADVRNPPGS